MRKLTQLSAVLLTMVLTIPAFAMGLDDAKDKLDSAKRQGLVGETPTGYLDVVHAAGDARDVVETINEARRNEYTRIAEKHAIPVTQVETVAGKKAIEKTPSGQFVLIEGQWVKK
ncbi:YdbL family protein [Marinobacter sp. AL4B]|uniref:YdbL family protein n=1 Tax=Marinobacter sp. AL4B TaxID=2871173 RepID=UPI001CAA469C|nr:YdbL family protein [Marinobacter sp. AL4B]MBZ0333886.1 YdbL family protein [Marinobacter sp. AL4B]